MRFYLGNATGSRKKVYLQALVTIIFCVHAANIATQDIVSSQQKTQSFVLKTQFTQIKDEFNNGLVYNGIRLLAGYSFDRRTNKSVFTFTPELGFGIGYSEGMGISWRVMPVDLFYGFKSNPSRFVFGAYLATDYQWQQYKKLQGGRLFWFSTMEIGPKLIYIIPGKSNIIEVTFSNSVAGFTSRPKPGTETYLSNLNISEFITNLHQNLEFGSFDIFNRTSLEIDIIKKLRKKMSFGYQFEYFDYFNTPRMTFMNHSINLKWKIGRQ